MQGPLARVAVAISRAVIVAARLTVRVLHAPFLYDVVRCCARPRGPTLLGVPLAVRALELARDAAEAAIRLVHTYDHSSMALGELWAVVATLPEDSQVGGWARLLSINAKSRRPGEVVLGP